MKLRCTRQKPHPRKLVDSPGPAYEPVADEMNHPPTAVGGIFVLCGLMKSNYYATFGETVCVSVDRS
jgi:hypothetical protein